MADADAPFDIIARCEALSTLKLSFAGAGVLVVALHRPEHKNAMNFAMFEDIGAVFRQVSRDSRVRCIVLCSDDEKIFTAGLDLSDAAVLAGASDAGERDDCARKGLRVRRDVVAPWQASLDAIAQCAAPVIAAVHGPCVGGGVDMILAADVRLCSRASWFSIAEVRLGIVADIGTLARLTKLVASESHARELVMTGRRFDADEAARLGLVSRVLPDSVALRQAALELAGEIAAHSPVAVAGIKDVMNFCLDHSVADGLRYVATLNMAALQTDDIVKSVMGQRAKQRPIYSNL